MTSPDPAGQEDAGGAGQEDAGGAGQEDAARAAGRTPPEPAGKAAGSAETAELQAQPKRPFT